MNPADDDELPDYDDTLTDNINILLTEVSLEMLSNRLFDINGKHVDSLYDLYDPRPSLVQPNNPTGGVSDLIAELRASSRSIANQAPKRRKQADQIQKPSKSDAASSSSSALKIDDDDDDDTAASEAEKQKKREAIMQMEAEMHALMMERKLEGFQEHFEKGKRINS